MSVPWNVTFAAWLPFPIVAVIGFVLALAYFCYFKDDFTFLSAFVSITLVVASLLVIILIPVDVYLVSSTKASNGSRNYWANNDTITKIEKSVLYAYYAIYSLMLVFVFLLFPFTYFSHVPPAQESQSVPKKDIVRGIKYGFASCVLLAILLVIGIVVPKGKLPATSSTIDNQLNFIGEFGCTTKILENGLTFTINCLGIVGMICSIIYTAYGMSILPINLIKGAPEEEKQKQDMDTSINELMEKIKEINDQNADQRPLSEADRKLLERYSLQLSELQSQRDTMRHQSYSCFTQCKWFIRPIQICIGGILFMFSLLIVASITISNINRAISSLGPYSGYMFNKTTVVNPIGFLLLVCSKAFPLDYIVLVAIITYFATSSLSGMQHMGIWFLWIKLHRLQAGRSTVQALLFSAFVVAAVTLYSGVLAYTLAPQYITYGTQVYKIHSNATVTNVACSSLAPADECTMTRLMTFQTDLFYRFWVLGDAYFWCSWVFILVFIIGSVVSIERARKTVAQIMMNDNRAQFGSMERLV